MPPNPGGRVGQDCQVGEGGRDVTNDTEKLARPIHPTHHLARGVLVVAVVRAPKDRGYIISGVDNPEAYQEDYPASPSYQVVVAQGVDDGYAAVKADQRETPA